MTACRASLLAAAAAVFALPASQADPVSDAVRSVDWKTHALEVCMPPDARLRLTIVIEADWMERRVVRMPMRVVELDPAEVKAGTVIMDPVVLVPRTSPSAPLLMVQVSRVTWRSFVLGVTVHEGGPEMARSRFHDIVICRWQERQEFEVEGLKIRVFIQLGPPEPGAPDPADETSEPEEPRPRRRWPFGRGSAPAPGS